MINSNQMGQEMLKTLLSTIVTLAFVVCGATIALEALGLLFQAGTPDPGRRAEAFRTEIEVNLDPIDAPREVEGEPLWQAVDGGGIVLPAQHTERKVADAPQPAVAVGGEIALPVVDSAVDLVKHAEDLVAGTPSPPPQHEAPQPAVSVKGEAAQRAAADVAAQTDAADRPLSPSSRQAEPAARLAAARAPASTRQAEECTGPCAAKPVAALRRRPSSRRPRLRHAASGLDCPLSWWLR